MTMIHVVDAFTRTPGQGNRAGVVLEAEGLSSGDMQAIAAFAGFSETAFVLPAQAADHDLQVRYFTPSAEVPICGHATVATHFLRAQMLGQADYRVRALTGAGVLPVRTCGSGAEARVEMTQGEVAHGHVLDAEERAELLAALEISEADLAEGLPVQVVSTGHSKVMVPLRSRETVDGLQPSLPRLAALSKRIGCNGYFPFAAEPADGGLETHGRMFAPAIGIAEDPVTGNANGPAGAYLLAQGLLPDVPLQTYAGHQGRALGGPGTVFVTLDQTGSGLTVRISGHAVEAGTLTFTPGRPDSR
ncbi:PhzF family phenazine biosynthesis isomerase [Leisingera sp. JC11]|uniref:PhzF family phenazine biosynthesis isomerase n=1 Tax=Leisingera sp. JC11 TaxID=3042469 RepID=UPI003455243E